MSGRFTKARSDRVIGNLLRVLQNGNEVKAAVDNAIDDCAEVFDLFESIETARKAAEEAGDDDPDRREQALRAGQQGLHRYFTLCACLLMHYLRSPLNHSCSILFASWLNSTEVENQRSIRSDGSFERYVSQRPGASLFYSLRAL